MIAGCLQHDTRLYEITRFVGRSNAIYVREYPNSAVAPVTDDHAEAVRGPDDVS